MKPMKGMKPMEPMKPMDFGDPWWPSDLGQPATTGAQNDIRYAFFPDKHRLLVESNGKRTTYDSEARRITGVSQQQGSGAGAPSFETDAGPIRLDELKVVG